MALLDLLGKLSLNMPVINEHTTPTSLKIFLSQLKKVILKIFNALRLSVIIWNRIRAVKSQSNQISRQIQLSQCHIELSSTLELSYFHRNHVRVKRAVILLLVALKALTIALTLTTSSLVTVIGIRDPWLEVQTFKSSTSQITRLVNSHLKRTVLLGVELVAEDLLWPKSTPKISAKLATKKTRKSRKKRTFIRAIQATIK